MVRTRPSLVQKCIRYKKNVTKVRCRVSIYLLKQADVFKVFTITGNNDEEKHKTAGQGALDS